MKIGSGVEKLFPGAISRGDARVQDDLDGQGPKITHWDATKLGPMPNLAVLEAEGVRAEEDAVSVKAAKADRRAALLTLDPKKIADPALKAVVEYLQQENKP